MVMDMDMTTYPKEKRPGLNELLCLFRLQVKNNKHTGCLNKHLLMDLSKLIGIGVFLGFLPYILFKKYSEVRRAYLLFVLYLFPFIDLFITPVQYGGFSVFDGITLVVFLLIFHRLHFSFLVNGKYLVLFILLLAVLFVGALQSEFFVDTLIPFL